MSEEKYDDLKKCLTRPDFVLEFRKSLLAARGFRADLIGI